MFLHRGLVGEAHAVSGQNAGVGVDEDGFHPQRIGDETGVLAAGTAEALQGEAADVVAFLHRDLFDRVGHVGDGDLQEALGDLVRSLFTADFLGQIGKLPHDHLGVEGLVGVGAKDWRKVLGLDLSDADISVGDRQRAAAAVAGGAGIGAGGVRADAHTGAIEVQNGAAAGRHGVDRHHRCSHPNAGDRGLEGALEGAGVQRDVGGGAAHVEADDLVQPGHRGGARGADDASGGAGEDRVLALEVLRRGQAAV